VASEIAALVGPPQVVHSTVTYSYLHHSPYTHRNTAGSVEPPKDTYLLRTLRISTRLRPRRGPVHRTLTRPSSAACHLTAF
jgi:hypothetical protein